MRNENVDICRGEAIVVNDAVKIAVKTLALTERYMDI